MRVQVLLPRLPSARGWYYGQDLITEYDLSTTAAARTALRNNLRTSLWLKASEVAGPVLASGKTGEVNWTLDGYGLLTIYGTGKMATYATTNPAPWAAYGPVVLRVKIEDGVTNVGAFSFYMLEKLQKVELGNTIETVERYAFFQATKVWNIYVPASVTRIEKYAFRKAWGAKQIFMGNIFGWSAGTDPVMAVTLNSPAEAANCLKNTMYLKIWTRDVNAPEILDPNAKAAGSLGNGITWLLTNDGVLTVSGNGAMPNNLPNTVVAWAQYKNEITKIVIEDGVTAIGEYAFYVADDAAAEDKYSSLTEIVLPETLESIGKYAFQGCSGVKSLTIPASVTTISARAFRKCSFTTVTFADAEGWMAGTTALDLTNATTAATYLKNTYSASAWVKG